MVLQTVKLEVLEEYVRKGLLLKKRKGDLYIFNYSKSCQYSKSWDDITKMCRGLVVNSNGEVIAKSFNKFFNLFELDEEKQNKIRDCRREFKVYEKLDGVLGIMFNYNGEWQFCTRGAFGNHFALWMDEWYKEKEFGSNLKECNTYLFEMINKNNGLTVRYKEDDMHMLAIINRNTYEEEDYIKVAKELGLKYAEEVYTGNDINKALALDIGENKEGHVIKWDNNFRIKVKGAWYLQMFRLVSGLTEKRVWESLENGLVPKEVKEAVPEELKEEIMVKINNLENKYKRTEEFIKKAYKELPQGMERRELYEYMDSNKKYTMLKGAMFSLLDGKSIDKIVKEMIKP